MAATVLLGPWNIERAWLRSEDAKQLQSGDVLSEPPSQALSIKLRPSAEIAHPVTPAGQPKGESSQTYGGVVSFSHVSRPGVHQVTLSGPGWVDLVQNAKPLLARSHTGKSDCEGVRKSVRFDVQDGAFVMQLSGIPTDSVRVVMRAPGAP